MTNQAGEPLAGKTVILRGRIRNYKIKKRTKTDDNGCYHFGGLDGEYKIWVKRCKGEKVRTIGVPLGTSVNDVNFECQ
ncbi:MAG: carboxypeptidase regulatory-like domain-containing protein [Planctomycetes bacterium]|nr:carboxypeptidase regulatory-like domain-containing protein [Planctomycetota bacterium]